ncbi:uncharacterized protein LOC128882859 [Hylaeus volcanicus]|uniref:uncharacterized protein LOC128882859 n=1 Tax=Hylaeus volcanicus TaxID=313075 RepID=UPI0023B867C3|nr:uncharacterized protein LOC128882859 [Hylaeus volcanicus]
MVHFVRFLSKKLHALKRLRTKSLCLTKILPFVTKENFPSSTLFYSISETHLDPIVFPSSDLCTSLFFVNAWQDSSTSMFWGTQDMKRCVMSATLEMCDKKTLNEREVSVRLFSYGAPSLKVSKVATTDCKIAVAVKYMMQESCVTLNMEKTTIQREIYYHIFLLVQLKKFKRKIFNYGLSEDKRGLFGLSIVPFTSPVVDLLGYYMNAKEPQRCIMITALIFGVNLSQWMVLEKDVITQNYQHTRFTNVKCPRSLALVRLWD